MMCECRLQSQYNESFELKLGVNECHPLCVLQDLWHAQGRVLVTMTKRHPEYNTALAVFRSIFRLMLDGIPIPHSIPFHTQSCDANVHSMMWYVYSIEPDNIHN